MNGRVLDVEQRSDAWRQARIGKLTGSRAGALLLKLKAGGEPAARRDLRIQLATEALTNRSAEDIYLSRDMQRGIDREAAALAAYEAATGSIVQRIGFVEHAELKAGCSPDGLIDADGIVEVKCPRAVHHLGYIMAGGIPLDYLGQVLHNLWITERSWCDFVSFDDRFPPALQLFIARYTIEEPSRRAYELTARTFLTEVERQTAMIVALAEAPF